MGFDQPKQSGSSGVVIVVVAAVLLVAILGIVAVAGVGLFFVRTTSSNYSRAVAIAEANQAVAEELRAEGEIQQAVSQMQRAATQIRQSSVAATHEPRLNFEVSIDREGNTSIDGGKIGLDELKARLAKLKAETSNAFSVQINVDPECPVKHIIPVLDVCKEVGDVDISIVSSSGADSSPDEGDADDGSGK